jgi:hypothetical protein
MEIPFITNHEIGYHLLACGGMLFGGFALATFASGYDSNGQPEVKNWAEGYTGLGLACAGTVYAVVLAVLRNID